MPTLTIVTMTGLAGKHVVVTGASAGIGAELARQLGTQGCHLTIAARRIARLNEVASEVNGAGGQALVVPCDVLSRDEVFNLAQAAREHFGEIDIWVNNAGAGIRHEVLNATEEDMLHFFRLNTLSALWGYQAAIPPWLENSHRGQVVDICSVGGKSGFPYGGAYVAAKHAMSALADTLRQEIAGRGITVTTVYPGVTVSEFGSAMTDRTAGTGRDQVERIKRRSHPLVRAVTRKQETAVVVRAIVRSMLRPVPTVYPHRWAAFGALLNNLLPGLVLKQLSKAKRKVYREMNKPS